MKSNILRLFIFVTFISLISAKNESEITNVKPNIIYIMADDLGYGDLGCYGQKIIPTPNLDKMAAEGIRFTDFYSGNTVCAPSRYALMTGLHMGHAYIRGNGEFPIRAEEKTLPKTLKENGYHTGMYGKWGLGQSHNTGSPEKQGWDEFFGYTTQGHAHRYYTNNLWEIKSGKCVPYKMDSLQHSHPVITNAAFDFVKKNQKSPFFMYWAITMPHAEMYAPEETLKKYLKPDGSSIFPENKPFVQKNLAARSYRSQDKANANTAAMIEHLDSDIGRLMVLLKELGLDKNTYVFFTSDNGPHNEGGREMEFFDSNGKLRGFKRDLYEGGIRVPMIAWGANVPKGKITNEPLANWDVFPTLSELTKAKSPKNIDGISFVNTLFGKKANQKHDYLYWEFFENGFDQAVRKGNWKAVKQREKGNRIELYDLSKDISETSDLALKHPTIVAEMEKIMSEARTESELFKVKK
ncbi:arylsulfatase [Emticicia sp. SJ17W-69]|uniref:arylsulfatase n=1 Tax=Emticicia sp. SJ17W-69 TaxID=3421657 RepID=UPI003EBFAB0E